MVVVVVLVLIFLVVVGLFSRGDLTVPSGWPPAEVPLPEARCTHLTSLRRQ